MIAFASMFLIACAPGLTSAQAPPSAEVAARLAEARHAGWRAATQVILPMILVEEKANHGFPGVAAFVADVRKVSEGLRFKGEPKAFPTIDVDTLVAKNPNFWQANYEIAPGDPAWLTLHAGLLLAGGEASRAHFILTLVKLRAGLPPEFEKNVDVLLLHCGRVILDGNNAVTRGVERYDLNDHAGALRIYNDAVIAWPQNGWAHYEIAFTRVQSRYSAAKTDDPSRRVEVSAIQTPDVLEQFEHAKRHDPFRWKAYQGLEDKVVYQFDAMVRAYGTYEKLRLSSPTKPLSVAEMTLFSKDIQKGEQDEFALVVRQVVAARKGRYQPDDLVFVGKSLRRLVPGKITEGIIERMGGTSLKWKTVLPMPAAK